MRIIIFLFFSLTGCAYSQNMAFVQIHNYSDTIIDSVNVNVNNYNLKFGKIMPNDFSSIFFLRDSVFAKHDVLYSLNVFTKDNLIIKKIFFSNDLGYIPPKFDVYITKKLEVEIK